ncbi:MAG: hypothetical protein HC883_00235 [Bdellovibrionaceae bacterium]|nr:hypothetical protein [Pseudobdellovibrionaceae bacterium]
MSNMLDVQTQVIDQNQLSANDLNLLGRVDQFRKALGEIRSERILLVEKMRGIAEEIHALNESRAQTYSLFHAEALHLMPQLVVKDLLSFVKSLPESHQLGPIWAQYEGKVLRIEQDIDARMRQFNELRSEESVLAKEEDETLAMYDLFSSSVPGQVPSAKSLLIELQAVDVIPLVEEGNVQIKSAFELIDPEAQAMVLNQAISEDTGYDAHTVNQELMNNMPALVAESRNKTLVESVTELIPGNYTPQTKLIGIAVLALGLMYVFGGKKRD